MKTREIKVGAVYRLGGQHRVPRRVLSLDLASRGIPGGKIRIQSITAKKSIEVWSAEYFAERVIAPIHLAK